MQDLCLDYDKQELNVQASCYHNKTCNWSHTCTSTLFKVIRLPILIKMDNSIEDGNCYQRRPSKCSTTEMACRSV